MKTNGRETRHSLWQLWAPFLLGVIRNAASGDERVSWPDRVSTSGLICGTIWARVTELDWYSHKML